MQSVASNKNAARWWTEKCLQNKKKIPLFCAHETDAILRFF